VTPSLPSGVSFAKTPADGFERWTLRASEPLAELATGNFSTPSAHVAIPVAGLAPETALVGFAFTQFALPVFGRPGMPFGFRPADNLRSPAAMVPVLINQPDEPVMLLAPLDAWHEQIIGVRQSEAGIHKLLWGWHGDLDVVPQDFESSLGIFRGETASDVFRQWGQFVLAEANTQRPNPAANPLTSHLSYWTDNGAAYWYRTEPGRSLVDTLAARKAELDALGVRVGSWELDSWFYRHEQSRPVTEVGYLSEVPPTGMLEWAPRPDVLPAGVEDLRDQLGGIPLALHARHISPASPYLQHGDWWTDVAAHPQDQKFFDQWFADAASWGAAAIEQDWMLMVWFGVRQMRAAPSRALAWQRALDHAASTHGPQLIWCMATPGDLMATVELDNLIAVRTSDDYRYAEDPALLWRWYLTVNRLVDALDLVAFKDCFFSMADPGESSIDGDPQAEIEAMLSAFSAGIAGIGDRIGRTDPAIVHRVCSPDGRLVQPDRPIALADQSFFIDPKAGDALTWATAHTSDNGLMWHYVVALHCASAIDPVTDSFTMADAHDWLIYDWRTGATRVGRDVEITLEHRDWALFVFCPIERTGGVRSATIGDVTRYATMGHVRHIDQHDHARHILRWSE